MNLPLGPIQIIHNAKQSNFDDLPTSLNNRSVVEHLTYYLNAHGKLTPILHILRKPVFAKFNWASTLFTINFGAINFGENIIGEISPNIY